MQNARLNTQQRQALVKLVQNAYGRRIEKQRELYHRAVEQVTQEVKGELGITGIEEELRELEHRTKELESQKEELGFSKYNDHVITGSDAEGMIAQGAETEKERIRMLQLRMDKDISAIWTATELSEVKPMVDEILAEE